MARAQVINPEVRITFDIRDTWQARCLSAAKGRTMMVMLSVLAHNYDDAMPVLMEIVYPGFRSITAPFLCTAGKIAKSGHIVADMVTRDGRIAKDCLIYRNELRMRDDFRRLADQIKLCDADRVELFGAVKRWVVADRRLDPAMDPKDPDAKRLTH